MTGEPAAHPMVYALPIGEHWLVHSPWTGVAAVVNNAALGALREAGPFGPCPNTVAPLRNALRAPADARSAEGPGKLVIIPTRACNMCCVYCDFGAPQAPRQRLDLHRACAAVTHFAEQQRARGRPQLPIHFFGGEPTQAFTCVEAVVHFARALAARRGLVPWFELTTNGLFNPAWAPFLGDYLDSIVVSLDGPEALHDHSRPAPGGRGTFTGIAANLRRLAGRRAELCLRMCVTDRSAPHLPQITEELCRAFTFDVLSFEMLAANEGADRAGLHTPDPRVFAAGVLAAEGVAEPHGVRVVYGPAELVAPRQSSCPLGPDTLMLAPGGELVACYLEPERWERQGLDLRLGQVGSDGAIAVDIDKLQRVTKRLREKLRCQTCFCRATCAGGCHVEQTPPQHTRGYDYRCHATRLVTAARLLRALGCPTEARQLQDDASLMATLMHHSDDRCWPTP